MMTFVVFASASCSLYLCIYIYIYIYIMRIPGRRDGERCRQREVLDGEMQIETIKGRGCEVGACPSGPHWSFTLLL